MRLVAALTTALGVSRCADPVQRSASTPPPLALDWDLARSHRIADVDWRPDDRSSAYHFWRGDIQLALKLSGGRTLHLPLADIIAERHGGELYSLILRGHPKPLDEVAASLSR
jgi:hypothetical protein